MKKIALPATIFLFLLSHCSISDNPSSISDNPLDVAPQKGSIRAVLNQTNIDSLTLSVEQLSGKVGIFINGATDSITSRHADSETNGLAADFLQQKLQSYGLEVEIQAFNVAGENIIAIQRGTKYPTQFYMICGHYDSMPDLDRSPGADDNASGTATVLEAARVLSAFKSEYSIIYALWDEEEQGLLGSRHFVKSAFANRDTIHGIINIDMIGWDRNYDGTALISIQYVGNSQQIGNSAFQIATQYDLALNPLVVDFRLSSDNISFWEKGYSAIAISEHFGVDSNADYHTIYDRIENFNMAYFHNCARMAIATLADLVEVSVD